MTKVSKKTGAYFSYDDNKLGQGRENDEKFLKEHSEIAKGITEKIHISLAEADSNSI